MYAMYLRKSRKDIEAEANGEMETLARHEQLLTDYANRHNLQITQKYKEIVSGESIENRPEMQKLLDDIYKNKYEGVLVVELERLARGNTKDQGIVAEAFQYTNTKIVTLAKTYDPNNEYDQEYFEFGLFMSRREYKTITRRMQTGKLQSIKEGNYMGSLPPYGYDIDKRGRNDRTLKLNDQSKYIPMIFDWFVQDRLNTGEIARRLTDIGAQTRTGKKEWNRATITEILKNHLYIGKVRWNRRKVVKEFENGIAKKRKRRQVQDDYILANGKHPALISEEIFEAAQKLFTKHQPKHTGTKLINPFAGILKCKHCGKYMTLQMYKHKPNTKPRIVHPESRLCKVKSAYFDDVYEAIIKALQFEVNEFEYKMTNDFASNETERQLTIVNAIKYELNELENRQENLHGLLERGVYSDEVFIERNAKLTKQMEELKTRLKEESSKVVDVNEFFEKSIQLKNVIEALLNKEVDAKIKNNMLKDNIDYILYSVDNDELLLEVY